MAKPPTSLSTRYYRPIKFEYAKETIETINSEVKAVNDEIRQLDVTEIMLLECPIRVTHGLHFTMLDGKVAQAITNTSSASSMLHMQSYLKRNE